MKTPLAYGTISCCGSFFVAIGFKLKTTSGKVEWVMSLQQEIIAKLGVKPEIQVDDEIRIQVELLKAHVKDARMDGLLIAISGGVDSAVAAGLCKRATDELTVEKGREYKTVGVFQPYGEQDDIADSYAVAETFALAYKIETNIEETVNEIALEAEYGLKSIGVHRHISRSGKDNVQARTRMVLQYALALELNLLVVGSGHASKAITGLVAKHGEAAVDLTPLSTLSKRQVRQLAVALAVPQRVLDKAPSAILRQGLTEEAISDYLEGKDVEQAIKEKLEKQHAK
jgi:NAD+ synthase